MKTRIAVLMASYNRKEKTLACLRSLAVQELPKNVELEIYLTDDASPDGTAHAVAEQFPLVNLYIGTGSLFWAGGMRATWQCAARYDHDYYLLINDDTILQPSAIRTLLSPGGTAGSEPAIIIGTTAEPASTHLSYGGWKLRSAKRWGSYQVHDSEKFIDCDLGNANIMLVPDAIFRRIGMLAPQFTHALADYDYTLRAKKAGFHVRVAPGILGYCNNDHGRNWQPANSRFRERLQYLKSPKGLAYREYLSFIREHFPGSYPVAFSKLWLKTLFPFLWDWFKRPSSPLKTFIR